MIETLADLLAVDGRLGECELRQEGMGARASAASTVEHTKSADHAAGCEELVGETVWPTAAVTSLMNVRLLNKAPNQLKMIA
jgi:hypothetical protein